MRRMGRWILGLAAAVLAAASARVSAECIERERTVRLVKPSGSDCTIRDFEVRTCRFTLRRKRKLARAGLSA